MEIKFSHDDANLLRFFASCCEHDNISIWHKREDDPNGEKAIASLYDLAYKIELWIWHNNKIKFCSICKAPMVDPLHRDCGGDCLLCLARVGDLECQREVYNLVGVSGYIELLK